MCVSRVRVCMSAEKRDTERVNVGVDGWGSGRGDVRSTCSDKKGRVNDVLHFSAPKIEHKMDA